MNKKHYLYIGLGVAVLLAIYVIISCKDCKGGEKFTAKLKTNVTQPETSDVTHEQKEI